MITSRLEVSAVLFCFLEVEGCCPFKVSFFRHLWSKQSNFQRSRVHETILHWPSKPPMGPIFYRSLNLQLSSCQHRRWTQTWHDFLVSAGKKTQDGEQKIWRISHFGAWTFSEAKVKRSFTTAGQEKSVCRCKVSEEKSIRLMQKKTVEYHQHMRSHFCGIVVVFRSAEVCRQLHSSKAAAETESLHRACKDGAGNRLFTWDKMEKSGIWLHMNKR